MCKSEQGTWRLCSSEGVLTLGPARCIVPASGRAFSGRVPVTPPVDEELATVPFVENAEIVVVSDGGPPSIKSNASWALVPDREEVSRLTAYDNAKALLAGHSKKLIMLIVHAVVI